MEPGFLAVSGRARGLRSAAGCSRTEQWPQDRIAGRCNPLIACPGLSYCRGNCNAPQIFGYPGSGRPAAAFSAMVADDIPGQADGRCFVSGCGEMKRQSEMQFRLVRGCYGARFFGSGLVASFMIAVLAVLAFPATGRAENPRYASLVIDAGTGEVLHSSRADVARYPASLTKMMTLYLLFEALDTGKIRKSSRLTVSGAAAKQPPSKLRLRVGSTISVEDAIFALVTKSANDVAVVVAEGLGKSESAFASMMTRKARSLGMSSTTFRNASGLPDSRQKTTARDMARLGLALLRDFPHHYHYFSTGHWRYRGVSYRNHNKLLGSYPGMDGFKTGYISASGYNLVASAVRDGRRLIGVVFGGFSGRSRNTHMAGLLDKGFMTPSRGKGPFVVASGQGILRHVGPEGVPQPKPASARGNAVAAASGIDGPDSVPVAKPDRISVPSRALADAVEASVAAVSPPVARPVPSRAVPQVAPDGGTLLARVDGDALHEGNGAWGIQVGAFTRYAPAHLAVTQAARSLPHILMRTHVAIIPVDRSEGTLYRARLIGLGKNDSKEACRLLRARSVPCMPIQTSEQIADMTSGRS